MKKKDQNKILVVDDEEINLTVLKDTLMAQGYEVISASSSAEAVQMTEEDLPDLILLDIIMQKKSDFEFLSRLARNKSTQIIPVVMMTPLEEVELRVKALEIGADDFLTTPVDDVELTARVKSSLEKKRLRDHVQTYLKLIEQEKEKSETLLFNVLPHAVVDQLKAKQGIIAETHPDATVLFADIVGFTKLSANLPAINVLTMLNEVFSAFDELAEKYELEKIKTIGDAYMVVGGIPTHHETHPEAVAEMALDMLNEVSRHSGVNGEPLRIRVGFNTGPVMAGVIGVKRFVYDLWGDTVNTASRMESQGLPSSIQVSDMTYKRLQSKYVFEKRGVIYVKGKGEMLTYFLLGKKGDEDSDTVLEEIREKGEASHGMARAKSELRTLSLSDDLTGLHSRNGFVALAQQQIIIATRENRKALLLLIRLDNLEWINDEYGFNEGDHALKEVAKLLIETFRTSDLIGRLGENLFLVFGLEVSEASDEILIMRFRSQMGIFTTKKFLPFPLSISLARATWDPRSSETLEELLSEMEKNLKEETL